MCLKRLHRSCEFMVPHSAIPTLTVVKTTASLARNGALFFHLAAVARFAPKQPVSDPYARCPVRRRPLPVPLRRNAAGCNLLAGSLELDGQLYTSWTACVERLADHGHRLDRCVYVHSAARTTGTPGSTLSEVGPSK